jgi:hypothetical protein
MRRDDADPGRLTGTLNDEGASFRAGALVSDRG